MMLRNRHTCSYCGVSVLNKFLRPPTICDHCGQDDFTTKGLEVDDFYGGPAGEQLEFNFSDLGPDDLDDGQED